MTMTKDAKDYFDQEFDKDTPLSVAIEEMMDAITAAFKEHGLAYAGDDRATNLAGAIYGFARDSRPKETHFDAPKPEPRPEPLSIEEERRLWEISESKHFATIMTAGEPDQ